MSIENYRPGEISSLDKAIYRKKIKHLVELQEKGKFIVIDVESGDYEIDEQDVVASSRLRARRPNAVTYGVIILGGRIETTRCQSQAGHSLDHPSEADSAQIAFA